MATTGEPRKRILNKDLDVRMVELERKVIALAERITKLDERVTRIVDLIAQTPLGG